MKLVKYYLSSLKGNKSQQTIRSYKATLNAFFSDRSDDPINKVTTEEVRDWLGSLEYRGQPIKPATYNQKLAALSSFFLWCVENEEIAGNPCQGIKSAKQVEAPPQDISVGTLKAMFEASRKRGLRVHTILGTLSETGLRASELVGLDYRDLRGDRFHVRLGKGGKFREVPVGDNLQKLLAAYVENERPGIKPDDPLFVSDRAGSEDRRLTYDGLRYIIRSLSPDGNVNPHQLRHTFATMMLEKGFDPYHLQAVLGHSSPRMTQHYTKAVTRRAACTNARGFLAEGLVA